MEDEGWKLLLLCRLSPLIPYNVLNITMASTKIHFWPFAIVSFFGTPCPLALPVHDPDARLYKDAACQRLSADTLRLMSAGIIPECAFFVYTGEPGICSLSPFLCQTSGNHTHPKYSKVGRLDQNDQTFESLQAH